MSTLYLDPAHARLLSSELLDAAVHPPATPVTGATLVDATGPDGAPELVSTDPVNRLAYPVRDGVPILLASEARRVEG